MDYNEVPVGFAMALARNEEAVNAFAMMTRDEKQAIWDKARHAHSEREMENLVSSLVKAQ